ncbi:nucleotidyltransferase domain-containing protein [Leptospira sp. 201903070]|uniref:Nucleotidyltransferase domain-containing protein n=1 Tax=Leptospira ainlahdjerensis TaxID=2810033 RepID=A0ABS2UE15_9LEPT|nr:nucleotidyltransferase domain-containing protein [Leptospira ainlahdjerensis]MBM9578616.1 nucleotidyltransferase domain-containing protein [Leptospira ainlahdjerensis]
MSVIVFPKRNPLDGMSREELIQNIQSALREKVIKTFLFGSVARNSAHAYSDVDLIVITKTDLPFLKRQELLQIPVEWNLFVYTEEEWEKIREQSQYPGFWKTVFAEMIPIL